MTAIDIVFAVLIAVSALISLVRGAVREVISLAAWVGAFWVAAAYSNALARWFAGFVHVPWLAYVMSFVLLLAATVLVVSLAGRLLSMALKTSGLGWTDRLLGMVFGLARGLVVAAMLTIMITAMPVQQEAWFKQSRLLPYFNGATQKLLAKIPRAEIKQAMGRLDAR